MPERDRRALDELESTSPLFVDGDPDEVRRRLALDAELVDAAIEEAFAGRQVERDADRTLSALDQARSMVARNMLSRRRLGQEVGEEAIRFTRSQPRLLDDYLRRIAPSGDAICNLYLTARGEVWSALTRRSGASLETNIRCLVPPERGGALRASLDAYRSSLARGAPDPELLDDVLRMLGKELIALVVAAAYPEGLLLVPHRALHLVPLHAAYLPGRGGRRICLADLVPNLSYASSIYDAVWSEVHVRGEELPPPRRLRVLDLAAADLDWVRREHDWEREGVSFPLETDLATSPEELPTSFRSYLRIGWSGHAASSPSAWASSRLWLGSAEYSAKDVLTEWDLRSGASVVLAACETALDLSAPVESDDYCGLDLAFRIAGAGSVVASHWPVSDPVAALAAMLVESYEWSDGISTRAALGLFQRHLRTGEWKRHLMREDQMDEQVPTAVRRLLVDLAREDERVFQEELHWACLRCTASR